MVWRCSHVPMRVALEWIVLIAAFALSVAAIEAALPWMTNALGGFGPTVFTAQDPGPAVVALAAAVAVLIIVSLGAASILGPLRAMGAVGAGLAWGALELDAMRDVLAQGSPGPAAIAGILWSVLVLGVSWLLLAPRKGSVGPWRGPGLDIAPNEDGLHPDALSSHEAVRAAAIGAVAGLLAAWLVTRSDLRLQTAVATVVGGIACGFAGRLSAPHVHPVLLPPALILGGTLGAWMCWFQVPADLPGAIAAGAMPSLLLPLPIDWAAGALCGVPMGFAMAHGFLHHDDDSTEAPAA
jgi:hypothetical protein